MVADGSPRICPSDLDFLKLVVFSGFKDTQKDQSVQLPELASRVLKST